MLRSFACRAFYRWFLLESFSGVWLVYVEVLRNLLPKWHSGGFVRRFLLGNE